VDADLHSSVLWHLRDGDAMKALVLAVQQAPHPDPARSCVVAANAASLATRHEDAIRLLQRAVQAAPNYAYAWNLLGHEQLAVGNMDDAMASFQAALKADPRHYHAMYGQGMVHYRRDLATSAVLRFKAAAALNPSSPVLQAVVAMVMTATGNPEGALSWLASASMVPSSHPQLVYRRFSALLALGRFPVSAIAPCTALVGYCRQAVDCACAGRVERDH